MLALAACLAGCSNDHSVNVPVWSDGGILAGTTPLTPEAKARFEGIYTVDKGADKFGHDVVIKWNGDHLGIYTGINAGYFVMEAGSLDSTINIQGYWRYQQSDETGLAQVRIAAADGGRYILGDTAGGASVIRISGSFGDGQETPGTAFECHFERAIRPELLTGEYYFISHHGSGGTPTALPVSENSVEIARIIEQYGANGIEIDIRPTKDGIPVLYHDNSLNLRLIQRGPLLGPAEDYTYEQLRASVRLLHGEKIPSLEEFLDVVITETTLKFVYVDCKPTIGPYLATAAAIQKAALLKAQSLGRDVQIYLAITTADILTDFLALPDYQNIPSICELNIEDVRQANSHVWSPRFTEGTQNSDVAALHDEGRIAITWTVNAATLIEQYIREGSFDGMLSDYPTWVAYYYFRQ
jgi:glycerophosphoryl diester phosphodiesterase